MTRCGYVAVVGRPNVGKSTLVNAIMGHKVSIVTAKPQTTRHRILAIHTNKHRQIVFVDTPGIHRKADKAMNRLMNRTAANALADADLVLFVSEAGRWNTEDADALKRLESSEVPVIAVLNKVDLVSPREEMLAEIARTSERFDFAEILPLSATQGDNLDRLLGIIPDYLPESPFLFPEDMQTDRSPEFQAAELVREKLTQVLHQEIPYGLTVQVERYADEKTAVTIDVVIWVERNSQKGIVIGQGGQVLKRVGRAARIELKEKLGKSVHLDLWVKVKDNWADNEEDLLRLGYEPP